MLNLPKTGNLKLGGTEKGLPTQHLNLTPTLNYKEGEHFMAHPDHKANTSFSVFLPLGSKSIEISYMSFIKVNGISYIAKASNEDDETVYAFPIQPNFNNPLLDYPVIKLGPLKNFKDSLEMKLRSYVLLQILDNDNGLNMETFHFKSESAFTLVDLKTASDMTVAILDGYVDEPTSFPVVMTLEVHNKLYKMKKVDTVTYARLLPPSLNDMKTLEKLTNFNDTDSVEYKYFTNLSGSILRSREEAVKNAIALNDDKNKEYKKWFTESIKILIDNSDDFTDFLGAKVTNMSPEETDLSKDQVKAIKGLMKETGLPEKICQRAVLVFGQDAANELKGGMSIPKALSLITAAETATKEA